MLKNQHQTRPIWLAAGDVRPDEGERAQISADTVIAGQSVRIQPSSRRVTVAERPAWSLSCFDGIQGRYSSGESRFSFLLARTKSSGGC